MKRRLFIVACIIVVAISGAFLLLNKASAPLNVPSDDQEFKSNTNVMVFSTSNEAIQKMPFRPTRLPRQPIVESPSLAPESKSESKLSKAVQTIINGSDNKADYNDYRVAMLQLTRKLSTDDISALMEFLN